MTLDFDFPEVTPLTPEEPVAALGLLRNAAILSPLADEGRYDAAFLGRSGVFFADGSFVQACNVLRGESYEIRPKTLRQVPELKLAGRHLYGGQICRHFGHFLVESLSRLWPLMREDLGVQSLLFLLRRPNSPKTLSSYQKAFFRELGLQIPITLVTEPMQVEELLLPEQGFSDVGLVGGTAAFRHYIRHHLAPDIAPEGPERLYLSREGLRVTAGRFFNEENVSRNLAREGYEEFRPENHDFKTQIARYRAARQIIGVEGSAFHLFGFLGHQKQRAALIARRSDGIAAASIARQLQMFCGIKADVLNHIQREWDCRDGAIGGISSRSISQVDLRALSKQLLGLGYISGKAWHNRKVNFPRKIERLSMKTKRDYRQVYGPPLDKSPE